MTAEVITFGCRLNAADSDAMRALAADGGETVIVNTCAVTGEAVRQARQAIRKAKRANPAARVIVTGCAAQIEPQTFAAMPEVSRVLGNIDKFEPANLRFDDADVPDVRMSDIMAVRQTAPHMLGGFAERARAFVEVQNGCDHRCTFCIIPYGRGNSRSAPAGLVIDRIKALVDQGFGEVVLTGVDVTSYGPDLPGGSTLGRLVQRILTHVPELKRLRLSSIDSVEIDEALLDAITGESRLMPHLHLSLQAGDDMILKRMKRRHDRRQSIDFCARVRKARPDVAFGADLIAGFPTETDEMFENTLRLIDECDIVFGHIFPYSARTGTPAAKMPQVPVPVRKERAARLRAASATRLDRWLASLVGTTQRLLVEREDGSGHGESFAPIRIDGGGEPGEIVAVKTSGVVDGMLEAVKA
ncbi:tRNA (N(6)-L-threonylcarbamoyladenosine(37)-C(2))-methylthiotransferase MtaB [Tardibacter chloracetimidivorans]|uniref:tRNA (N(6)-L-threonylcarbamoyladenosine(37)-C(2))-methylthiotransferase MtaB n=1 Tax=Tardibacter chloracetimidivorans TaxID=1921510 RepID=A0A1L3ZUD6_9SPHN|nr:tRNA (N(6)-L-threonylcarbamoyladenosine(37)-C(2))-methylthiotransferase MtaB [Tardibacter chloracetimidivorans]